MSPIAKRSSRDQGALGRPVRRRWAADKTRPHQLGGIASLGSRRFADGDRVSAVLNHGRARQAIGPAARQLSDCLLPLLLRIYRVPAFRPSQEGPSRLPHDPFLRPFPARRDRRCCDNRRLLRDDPTAADRFDGDQLHRPAVHNSNRHLPARRKGAAAGARHCCRLYRRTGDGPAR